MKNDYRKIDYPVSDSRHFLEPGPVILVSSRWKDSTNVMTVGWHTVIDFTPALVGCVISEASHSFALIRKSGECVINVPAADMAKTVVAIGNCSGRATNKFEKFGLTPLEGKRVKAPLIKECFANLECRLVDGRMIKKYNLFIFEVVKAHAPRTLRMPKMLHYAGHGQFLASGRTINLRRIFRPEML